MVPISYYYHLLIVIFEGGKGYLVSAEHGNLFGHNLPKNAQKIQSLNNADPNNAEMLAATSLSMMGRIE